MNCKSWLLRLCNFLWFNNTIGAFFECLPICVLQGFDCTEVVDRCSFRKSKLDWLRRWSRHIVMSYFWTRGCLLWSSICVTGNPNWWVWMESLLCSWKWFGCSLSNLLVLVDGLHTWYSSLWRDIARNMRQYCWHSLMTSFWCDANARVEVVSYLCVAVNLLASYSCALVSFLLIMCIAFVLYMDCIWVNTNFTYQCAKMAACHCTSLIQSFIWRSSACDKDTYVKGIWIVSTSCFRGSALIMRYTSL